MIILLRLGGASLSRRGRNLAMQLHSKRVEEVSGDDEPVDTLQDHTSASKIKTNHKIPQISLMDDWHLCNLRNLW